MTRNFRLGAADAQAEPAAQPQAEPAAQPQAVPDPKAGILQSRLRQALRDGTSELPARDRWLLRLRTAGPPKSYREISDLMVMPVSSVCPALGHCLEMLRQSTALRTSLTGDLGRGRRPRRRSA